MTLPNGGRPAALVQIPFNGDQIIAAMYDGKPHAFLRPIIERLGVDYGNQLRKLKTKSWATAVTVSLQLPGDTQTRDHVIVDVRTLAMLLATIDEHRVGDDVRPALVEYQGRVADAIEAYFAQGGAINPNATGDQLDGLADDLEVKRAARKALEAKLDLGVIQAMGEIVDPTWRESLVRHTWAVYKGEAPAIAPENRMLMTQPYLLERGISKADLGSISSVFGKRVKAAYVTEYGREPEEVLALLNGRERPVKGYYERDRHLFDAVFSQYYAHLAGPQQLELGGAA